MLQAISPAGAPTVILSGSASTAIQGTPASILPERTISCMASVSTGASQTSPIRNIRMFWGTRRWDASSASASNTRLVLSEDHMPEDVLFCWSGGKDSAMALHALQSAQNHRVSALLTTVTEH